MKSRGDSSLYDYRGTSVAAISRDGRGPVGGALIELCSLLKE